MKQPLLSFERLYEGWIEDFRFGRRLILVPRLVEGLKHDRNGRTPVATKPLVEGQVAPGDYPVGVSHADAINRVVEV